MQRLVHASIALLFIRHKTLFRKIANRKKMELFYAKTYGAQSRLAVAAPLVAEEWDYEKNPMGLYPEIVCVASLQPCWWICNKCSCSFEASPDLRVLRGGRCPCCGGGSLAGKDASRQVTGSDGELPGERNPSLRNFSGHWLR